MIARRQRVQQRRVGLGRVAVGMRKVQFGAAPAEVNRRRAVHAARSGRLRFEHGLLRPQLVQLVPIGLQHRRVSVLEPALLLAEAPMPDGAPGDPRRAEEEGEEEQIAQSHGACLPCSAARAHRQYNAQHTCARAWPCVGSDCRIASTTRSVSSPTCQSASGSTRISEPLPL